MYSKQIYSVTYICPVNLHFSTTMHICPLFLCVHKIYHMIRPFKVFTIRITLQPKQKIKCYTSWPTKCRVYNIRNLQNLWLSTLISPIRQISGNYKKQLQHPHKWHTHLCTIWGLSPALPPELVTICRLRRNMHLSAIICGTVYRIKKLAFYTCLTTMGMDMLRVTVRAHYGYGYGRCIGHLFRSTIKVEEK